MKHVKPTLWMALAALGCAGPLCAASPDAGLADWVTDGRWPRGPEAVESTPQKQLAKAERLMQIGDARQSADNFKKLADVYPESEQAEQGLIQSSKQYLAAGDYTKAREQLDELRRRYVHPSYLDAVGEVEIRLARGFLEGKGEGGTYRLASRIRKARAIFKRQLDNDPEGRWSDDATLGLGECDEALGDFDGAIKQYKTLLEQYPRSELRAEAESRIAACISKREPQPERTESDTLEARQRIQQARDEAMADNADIDLKALEENEKILAERQARKRFDQAQFYIKNNKFRAAEVYFELIRDRFPDTEWAKKAEAELEKLRRR